MVDSIVGRPRTEARTVDKKVFRAHAAPYGVCDNLINALKLLANGQIFGDSPIKMEEQGLLEKGRLQIKEGHRGVHHGGHP